MHHANLPMEMSHQLYGEIFTIVTMLDGLTIIELSGKHAMHYKHFFGEMPGFAQNLHTVGEAGTVKIKTDTTPKLEDCNVHCLFVGYSLTPPTGCYQMYDPKKHSGCIMCDVVWLHHMFYQKTNLVGELNTDHICVRNWSHMTKAVMRFIDMGEGVSDVEDEEPQEIHSSTNDSNELEDQPVGNDIVEE